MRSNRSQLLCITGGVVHPSLFARMALVSWIRRLPTTRIHLLHDLDAILRTRLERYSAILLYFHASKVSEESLAALDTYVAEGGGLVAIHSASASFEEHRAYSAILGGRFLQHGVIAPYTVRQTRKAGAFAGGGPSSGRSDNARRSAHLAPDFPPIDSFTIRDELYVHEYDPDNFVHFVVDTEDGPEPVVWSRLHGKGRVFYLAAGHRTDTLRHPAIRNILRYGIRWAADAESRA